MGTKRQPRWCRDLVTSCYTWHVDTRNITLTMPAELVRRARILAAQRDTSVSALVVELLQEQLEDATEEDSLWAIEEAAMATGIGMRVGDLTWTRDELHER